MRSLRMVVALVGGFIMGVGCLILFLAWASQHLHGPG